MPIMKENGILIPKYRYNIPNMNQCLITSQLPNLNEIYNIRHTNRCNSG